MILLAPHKTRNLFLSVFDLKLMCVAHSGIVRIGAGRNVTHECKMGLACWSMEELLLLDGEKLLSLGAIGRSN